MRSHGRLLGILALACATASQAQTFSNFELDGTTFTGGLMGTPGSVRFVGDTQLRGGFLNVINLDILDTATLTGTAGDVFVTSESQNFEPAIANRGTFTQKDAGHLVLRWQSIFVNRTNAIFKLQNVLGIGYIPVQQFSRPARFVNESGARFEAIIPVFQASQVDARFDNRGHVDVEGGRLVLAGGGVHQSADWISRPSGSIELRGQHVINGVNSLSGGLTIGIGTTTLESGATMDITDQTILVSGINAISPSVLQVNQGQFINKGTVNGGGETLVGVSGGGSFENLGTLNGMGLLFVGNGSWRNGPGASVTFNRNIEVHTNGVMHNQGTIVVGQFASMTHAGALRNDLGASFTVRGQINPLGADYGSVANSGNFTVAAGAAVQVGGFVQEEGNLVVNGSLANRNGGTLQMLGGVLSGTGLINGELFVGGGPGTATFKPGSSPGTLTVAGGFSLLPGGVLELEIEKDLTTGLVSYDRVVADTFFLDGHVSLLVGNGVEESDVAGLRFLDCGGTCSVSYGDNFSFDFPKRPGSSMQFDENGLQITSLAPVPEPGSYLMLLAGLGLVGGVVARRRRRA